MKIYNKELIKKKYKEKKFSISNWWISNFKKRWHLSTQKVKTSKIALVITDGVGFRNYIMSDFLQEAKHQFQDIIIFSGLPKSCFEGFNVDNCTIEELEDFVIHGPERERQAEVERRNTIPPPAEIEDRKREREFMKKLSRREIMNEKRSQASNGLLLILLLLSILAIGAWIYRIVQL